MTSTTLNYYTTRTRASDRKDRIRSDMDRSSAYIYGSMSGSGAGNRSSVYDPMMSAGIMSSLKRESSFSDSSSRLDSSSSSRLGRSRVRDHSIDILSKPRRSSSLELSAPVMVKPRLRDRSTDFSVNGIERIAARPKTMAFDSKYEANEYRDLTTNADKYLTIAKYKDYDKTKDMTSMIEEERRSKAYSKIINQASSYQQEMDASRACMSDIFMNTNGFSTKTVAAIAKEVIYKEEKGAKNYSWRKDMESYEENLEKVNSHKRAVQEATKTSRDVYKSTESKIRDYDRESRRTVESDTSNGVTLHIRPASAAPETKSYTPTPSAAPARPSYTTYTRPSAVNTDYNSEPSETPVKKGSWRKDLEKYEEDLTLNKVRRENQRKIESYSEEVKSESGSARTFQTEAVVKRNIPSAVSATAATAASSSEAKPSYSWKKPESFASTPSATEAPKPTYSWKKPEVSKKEEAKVEEVPKTTATSSWRKPEPEAKPTTPPVSTVQVEKKVEPPKPEPSISRATEPAKAEVKPEESTTPKWKKPAATAEPKPEPKVEEPKPAAPKWKKPETAAVKKEEEKKEEVKPAPKWKKPESVAKKEEPKVEEPKPAATPKWKKVEPAKKEEVKVETPKPAPKWKKPETIKKEEPAKVEPPKPAAVPKWKKPETAAKKEEPKAEEPKPAPKWKKPETAAKKEEPKPEEVKPTPKWKKPETAKPEPAPAVEEPKPTPKWKKPAAPKAEEKKEVIEEKPKSVEEEPALVVAEPEPVSPPTTATETENGEKNKVEEAEEKKKEEEEEEDTTGMRAMRKENMAKFADMDAEFDAGRSKLAALRAKMKRLREASKASAAADAAADEAFAASRRG